MVRINNLLVAASILLAAAVSSCAVTQNLLNVIFPVPLEEPSLTVLDGAKASEKHRGLILAVDVKVEPDVYYYSKERYEYSLRETLVASGYIDRSMDVARFRVEANVKGIYDPSGPFRTLKRTKIIYRLIPMDDALPMEFAIVADGSANSRDGGRPEDRLRLAMARAFQENFRKLLAELAALD